MNSVSYRAGIVGCGRIACGFDDDPLHGYVSTHAGAYVRTSGLELVALSDLDRGRLELYGEKFHVRGRYEDYREMLAREKLDVLSVCTWNDTHREIVEQAVSAGVKAIFCEKPVAESLASADAILRCCGEAGVLLLVDHQRRFDRFHQRVACFIREGQLGRIQQITCYYTAGIANTGTHLLDLLRFFCGEVEWVQAVASRNSSPNSSDPNLDGLVQFREGLLAVLQACDVRDYTIFEVNLLGTLGRLRIMSHGFEAQFEEARESARFSGYRELYASAVPFEANGTREYMLQAMNHLRECLATRGRPVSSGEDGRAALEIICALRESAESGGRRVDLPLRESSFVICSR